MTDRSTRRRSTTARSPRSVRAVKPAQRSSSSRSRLVAATRSPVLSLGAILIAVLLGVLGILLLRSNSIAVGAIIVVVALGLFLLGSRSLGTTSWDPRDSATLATTWIPAAVGVLGIFFSALAVYEVGQPSSLLAHVLAASFWLLSLVGLAAGVLWLDKWHPHVERIISEIRGHARESILVLVIFAAALGARLYALDYHPYPWSGDEASVGTEGMRILNGENTDLFNTGWSGQPNLSFVPAAIGEALLGRTILAVRVTSAIVGALTILTLYALARVLFGPGIALISAAFLALFPFHLQFSRIGVSNVVDGLMITASLWLVMRAVRQEGLSVYLWAGITTGLTLYTYVGSRLVLALAFVALTLVAILEKGYLRSHLRQIGVFLVSAAVTMAPMAFFFIRHPDIFMTRVGQAGILFNGWLAQQAASTGKTILSILFDQFTRSTLVFIASPAIGNFFNSPQPYLTLIGSLLFLLGMAVAFQRSHQIPYLVLLAWFWSVVFLGGVLTVSPPANTRMVMTAPAIALFIGIGLFTLNEVLKSLRVAQVWQQAVIALVVGILVVQNALFYFGAYRSGHFFDDANAEVAMHAGLELQDLGPGYTFAMIGQPRMFSGFPTIVFLAPGNHRIDIDPSKAASADLSGDLPAFIVATPDNLAALQEISQRYPGGKWEAVPRSSHNETLYFAYTLEVASAQSTP